MPSFLDLFNNKILAALAAIIRNGELSIVFNIKVESIY